MVRSAQELYVDEAGHSFTDGGAVLGRKSAQCVEPTPVHGRAYLVGLLVQESLSDECLARIWVVLPLFAGLALLP